DDASFVAERDNKLVGYCISYVLPGSFGIDKSAWVAMIGVDPDFMGQGIGALLAKEILGHYQACGITKIYTSVRWDSTDMLSFFKSLGFQRSDFINLHKSLE
ncbi:MAG: GNAT family N-acetyltransferase, partial [Desulfobacula sp.]